MKLLYSTENSAEYSVMTFVRIESKKKSDVCICMWVCICVYMYDLPRWFGSKRQACNAGDVGSLHGSERSPGEGNSCLGHPMDRGTCIHGGHKEAESDGLIN